MLPLRFRKVWLGLGWLMVAFVCFGSLLPAPEMDLRPLVGDKLIHFGAYLVLTVWFGGLYGRPLNYVVIAAVLIALGLVLDMLQGMMPTRQFDLLDVLANSAGALVGFVALLAILGGWCGAVERWLSD